MAQLKTDLDTFPHHRSVKPQVGDVQSDWRYDLCNRVGQPVCSGAEGWGGTWKSWKPHEACFNVHHLLYGALWSPFDNTGEGSLVPPKLGRL